MRLSLSHPSLFIAYSIVPLYPSLSRGMQRVGDCTLSLRLSTVSDSRDAASRRLESSDRGCVPRVGDSRAAIEYSLRLAASLAIVSSQAVSGIFETSNGIFYENEYRTDSHSRQCRQCRLCRRATAYAHACCKHVRGVAKPLPHNLNLYLIVAETCSPCC